MSTQHPNSISSEAYVTLVMRGLETSLGVLNFTETTLYNNPSGPNTYGTNTIGVKLYEGSYNSLFSSRELFKFSEPVEGYTNINLGQTTVDIGGIGVWADPTDLRWIKFCVTDPSGNLLTQYSSPCEFPHLVDGADGSGNVIVSLFMTYNTDMGGYVPYIGIEGTINHDPVGGYPDCPYAYSTSIGLFGNVGTDVFEWALHDNYWNDEDTAPDGQSGGGGGGFNVPDVPVDNGAKPTGSILSSGMVSLYVVTETEMQSLAQFLWSSSFIDNVKKNWSSPMENIITYHMLPISSSLINVAPAGIKIGNTDTGVQSHKVVSADPTNAYIDVDLGNISAVPFYNTFADYDGRATLYIPYVGFSEIDLSDCMDGYLNIQLRIDIFTGDFVAMVYAYSAKHNYKKHCIDQKTGNMAISFPLSGSNYMGVYTSMLSAVGAISSGNLLGGTGELMTTKPQYGKCSNISGTAGALGTKYPYLIFHRASYFEPDNGKERPYRYRLGVPSNQFRNLHDITGYIKVVSGTFRGQNIPCTSEELDMITQYLEDGIITQDTNEKI